MERKAIWCAMPQLEIDIEEKACELALDIGVTNVKMKAAGVNGYPDRLFFIPGGRPLFIEFKRPGLPLDPLQVIIINRLRYYGYHVEVCDSVEEALAFIKGALESAQLSKESREVLARARSGGAIARPRPR